MFVNDLCVIFVVVFFKLMVFLLLKNGLYLKIDELAEIEGVEGFIS